MVYLKLRFSLVCIDLYVFFSGLSFPTSIIFIIVVFTSGLVSTVTYLKRVD